MDTTTIEYAYIEDPPFESVPVMDADEQSGERDELAALCADLPAAFRDTLTGLLVSPDDAHCARCDDPVGFVLRENAAGFERLAWTPTGLARHGDGPVAVLCEHCTPYLPESQED